MADRADRQHTFDEQPGEPPEIHTDAKGVTYSFTHGPRKDAHLVIRCDEEGEIWVSIQIQQDSEPPTN